MISKIGFGGGCHWCTEAVFQSLKGVAKVEQGWIASFDEYNSFSEAVIVYYNETVISLETLIDVHLYTHRSNSDHSMRKKYRSAVYTFSENKRKQSQEIILSFQPKFGHKLITKVHPFKSFKPSPSDIQDYYKKNPSKPFCEKYIDPKLSLVAKLFETHIDRKFWQFYPQRKYKTTARI